MARTFDRTELVGVGLRQVVVVLALAAVYVAAARIGLMLALPPEQKATAVWPPSGIALAALLLLGSRVWPGIWLGAFLANLMDYFTPANSYPLTAHWCVSAGIATGSTLQALAGRFLVRRWIGEGNPFDVASHAFLFAGVAMLMCLIAATCGVVSLFVGGFAQAQAIGFVWWTWWLGDMTGVLTVGSLILIWAQPLPLAWSAWRVAEAMLLLVFLVVLGAAIFGVMSPVVTIPPPLAYLTVPVLVWATFRFGQHGAVTALFLTSGLAVLGTAEGNGPFAQPTGQASLLLLQVFMGVIAVTALVMAAVLSERQTSQEQAQHWEEIFAQATWAVALADPADDTLQAANAAFAGMHGYTIEELLGKPLANVFAPEFQSEATRHVQAAHEKGDYVYESIHVRKDGTRFPCLTHVTTFKDAHGKVRCRASTFQDISDLKRAEEELRENERRFRTLAAAVPGFLFSNQPDGWSDFTSRQFYEYTGMPEEAANGYGWTEAVHPDDQKWAAAHVLACVKQRKTFERKSRYRAADGT
jgi:PAS domain S-box-containing protein